MGVGMYDAIDKDLLGINLNKVGKHPVHIDPLLFQAFELGNLGPLVKRHDQNSRGGELRKKLGNDNLFPVLH
jgi:hypothetical protein